jgi:hypothetical protein
MFAMNRATAFRSIVLAAALGALCAGSAAAQQRSAYGYQKPGPEIGIFGGYYIASDLYNVTSGLGAGSQIGLDNSFMWGGRLGMSPNRNLGVEFAYTHAGSDVKIKKSTAGGPTNSVGTLNLNSGDMNFLFKQPSLGNPRATGFFELGFGWTWTDPSGIRNPTGVGQNSLSPKTLFNWNFGLGGMMDLNDKFALRLEGRWRITDTHVSTSSGVWCDYYGYCYSYSSDLYNSGELTAGLTYKLGGRK